MSDEKPVLVMWPSLHWRLDDLNTVHAHVTLFDHGGAAGKLVLDRTTWDALTHHGARCVPESEAMGR